MKSHFSHVSEGPRHDQVILGAFSGYPRTTLVILGAFSVKLPEKSFFALFIVTQARPRPS
ncbi:hypothetical protein T11_5772 [Trichinella zimbabwensis]|uniref:Uncharacterized protein n=1 Tax=Trichinella zimbabwensis TaxID=268475 RepID=A0A0V1DUS3_9BILA|nr:hypothetical protein T11_5772 [Trichinella zimbabwensis]